MCPCYKGVSYYFKNMHKFTLVTGFPVNRIRRLRAGRLSNLTLFILQIKKLRSKDVKGFEPSQIGS